MIKLCLIFLVSWSTIVLCEDIANEEDEDSVFNRLGEISDDELWNLLKQASRNTSEEKELLDYVDYADFEESSVSETSPISDIGLTTEIDNNINLTDSYFSSGDEDHTRIASVSSSPGYEETSGIEDETSTDYGITETYDGTSYGTTESETGSEISFPENKSSEADISSAPKEDITTEIKSENSFATTLVTVTSRQTIVTPTQTTVATIHATDMTSQATVVTSQTDVIPSQTSVETTEATVATSQTDVTPSQTTTATTEATVATSQTDVTPSQTTAATTEATVGTSQTDATPSQTTVSTTETTIPSSQTEVTPTRTSFTAPKAADATTEATVASSQADVTPSHATVATTQATDVKVTRQTNDTTTRTTVATTHAGDVVTQATVASSQADVTPSHATVATTQATDVKVTRQTNDTTTRTTVATTHAGDVVTQATVASSQADVTPTNATVATTQAPDATTQAAIASGQTSDTTTQTTVATTQARDATTQATVASSQADVTPTHATVETAEASDATAQAQATFRQNEVTTPQTTVSTAQAIESTNQATSASTQASTTSRQTTAPPASTATSSSITSQLSSTIPSPTSEISRITDKNLITSTTENVFSQTQISSRVTQQSIKFEPNYTSSTPMSSATSTLSSNLTRKIEESYTEPVFSATSSTLSSTSTKKPPTTVKTPMPSKLPTTTVKMETTKTMSSARRKPTSKTKSTTPRTPSKSFVTRKKSPTTQKTTTSAPKYITPTTPLPSSTTLRPIKGNKFDPKRISVIEKEIEDITEAVPIVPRVGIPSTTKKISIFDTKKLFMIDEVTSPTIDANRTAMDFGETPIRAHGKKKPISEVVTPGSRGRLDPSRIFGVVDEPAVTRGPPAPPVSLSVAVKEAAAPSSVQQGETVAEGSSIPELACFQVSSGGSPGAAVRLTCLRVDPRLKAILSRPFLVDIRSRPGAPQQSYRRRTVSDERQRDALLFSPGLLRQRLASYSIGGNVFRSGDSSGSFRLSLSAPGGQLDTGGEGLRSSLSSTSARLHFPSGSPGEARSATVEKTLRSDRAKRSTPGSCSSDSVLSEDGSRSLVFVFDNTGSMGTELEEMREAAKEITTQMTYLKQAAIKEYVLVLFNDPWVSEPYCTSSYTEFIEKLEEIQVHGGQDCPEHSLTGLLRALAVARSMSFLFVITDASPKDKHLEGRIVELIMRKLPSIFFLITGDDCPSDYDVYERIASITSVGMLHKYLAKSDVKEVLNYVKEKLIKSQIVPLVKSTNPAAAAVPYPVAVPVGGNISQVTFSVSGLKPRLEVFNPKGSHTPGERREFSGMVLIDVNKPMPGVWTALAGSSSPHTVSAIGTSDTNFRVGFSVLPTSRLSELSHRPLKGGENYVLIEVSNPKGVKTITSIEFIDLKGDRLAQIDLKKHPTDQTLYSGGPFVPPNDYFNMKMHGIDIAGNPISRISPTAITAQLPELPYVTMLSRLTAAAGSPLQIKCHVESLVPVHVELYKKSSRKPATFNYKQSGDAFFELSSVTPADAGLYVCCAKNIAGEQTKEIQLTVSVTPPAVHLEPRVYFTANRRVEIPCDIQSSVSYEVRWMKGDNSIFYPISNSSRIYHSVKRLTIESPSASDEGWYQCTAANEGGATKAVTSLKMSSHPLVEVSRHQKFQRNYNISIRCIASGAPQPDVSWLKDGVNFSPDDSDRVAVTTEEIHISRATNNDAGTYTCTASNLAGKVSKDTELLYQEKPRVSTPLRELSVLAGQDIRLVCQVSGIPLPELIWKKDGSSLSEESLPNSTVLSLDSLQIRAASLADSGLYSCTASNEVGTDEVTIQVQVEGLPPRILEPPQDVSIELGESGRLVCTGTGQPPPQISWRRSSPGRVVSLSLGPSLEFVNASLSDAGEYWCIAENSLGRAEASASVNITGGVSPVLERLKDMEVQKTAVGASVQLTCTVLGGNPRPRLAWFKDGVRLQDTPTSGFLLGNGSYFISSVNPTDAGIFECVASNELGRDVKKIELKLYEPPKIETSSSSNIMVKVGSSARLECSVTGDPKPNVTWKRYSHANSKIMNGVKLEDSDDLYFERVTEEDSGRYICKAENLVGIARRPFALHVMVPPQMVPWPVEKLVEVGDIVTLECRVRAVPRPAIRWLKDEQPIPRSKYYGQFLRFYATKNDSGSYSCTAENKAGTDRTQTNLIVLVPPQIAEAPPYLKVISGSDVVLPCTVSGNPQPSVLWQSNGELIKKELGSWSGSLTLTNVTEADAGTYTCTAENKAGLNKKKIELIVLTPPKIVPWPAPLKVVLTEFVNVSCEHSADPPAQLTWYKDRQRLSSHFIGRDSRLEFTVEPFHRGVYTCEARNEAGVDSKDFLLVILDPPTFAQHQLDTYDVLSGRDLEMPCIAFGDPKPAIGWNRNGIELQSNNKTIVNSESGTLKILEISAEDGGGYNCTAANRAGRVWRQLRVNVLEFPSATIGVSNDEIIKEGVEVELRCDVTGRPAPRILWKKDDRILPSENNNNLRFVAHYKDSGNYTCLVKNPAGEASASVQLNVSVLPEIFGPREERLVVLEGEDVLLNCSVQGVPEPRLRWSFNGTHFGKYLPYTQLLDEWVLKLPEISRERNGIYSCEAQNLAGTSIKKFIINVHVKPFISDHFERHIEILEGKDFALPCEAEGVPQPRLTWWVNDSQIAEAGSPAVSPAVFKNILLIFNADKTTAGIYSCNATNEEGVALRNYTISIKELERPIAADVEYFEMLESSDGTLHCRAKPGSDIVWLKDNKTLDKMPPERSDDVHFLVSDGGQSLKITEAFAGDSGLYSCLASDPREGGSPTISTRHFYVNVQVPPYFLDLFPETDFTVRENSSLLLDCPVRGNPPPVVNWRLLERSLPVNEYTLRGVKLDGSNSLLFSSARPQHAGLYVCSASNKWGSESRTYNLKVVGPPQRLGGELTPVDLVSGGQLELLCSVEGSPQPDFSWTFQPSSASRNETILKYVSQKIHIGYAQAEDEGVYTCLASNPYGNATKQFNVSVYETPRIKRDVPDRVSLALGEDLHLTCAQSGRKPSSIQWFFNGIEVNHSSSSSRMGVKVSWDPLQVQYSLTVGNVSKAAGGRYTCSLYNIAGTDRRDFTVEVIAPPHLTNYGMSEKVHVNSGKAISLHCPVQAENAFKIIWKKNGMILSEFENGSLTIDSSRVEDEGTYTCVGSNIAGWLAFKFELMVLAVPELLSAASGNITVPLDGTLQLNCSVSGSPKPGIVWTKNLEQINEINFPQVILFDDDQLLKIDDVTGADGGKYSCFPSNIAGSAEKHFQVTVIEPPYVQEKSGIWNKLEKTVTSDIYKRSVLRCPLTGSPEPRISWFKGSEEIKEDNPKLRISIDSKVLIIKHADESTAGMYECLGQNDIGNTSVTFHFHVKIPMEWSGWSKWSECSASCDGGSRSRERECLGGGVASNELATNNYLHLYNQSCSGPSMETQPCNQHVCPVDGGWGKWSEWGACSESCGSAGRRRRTRRCNSPLPAHGGADCTGDTFEDLTCDLPPCPINGNWGDWSEWSGCAASCGPSINMRTRRCNSPAPQHGGTPCSGNSRDIVLCRQKRCPEERGGHWSAWSGWGPCSASCGTGRQVRLRSCLLGLDGTDSCLGVRRQSRLCKSRVPCEGRQRVPRQAELTVHGELNGERLEERLTVDIQQEDSEVLSFSKPLSHNPEEDRRSKAETVAYLPFIVSPLSWLTARGNERGINGLSLTNGSFHENSTYQFLTGEEMEVESEAERSETSDALKLNINVKGRVPATLPAATVVIQPYSEEILQKEPDRFTSSSTVELDADGRVIPVSVRKTVQFPRNKVSRIAPVERLYTGGSRSYVNSKTRQLEFRANPSEISSRVRDACPLGFKYNLDSGECTEVIDNNLECILINSEKFHGTEMRILQCSEGNGSLVLKRHTCLLWGVSKDINECRRRGLNSCRPSEICINILGSYSCECRQGFRLSPLTFGCKDINECWEGTHGCSHRCVNTRGSYQCLCPRRLILAEDMRNCLEDINECSEAAESVCREEQLCVNTPGSYVCIEAPCPDRFILSPETRSCLLLCLEEEALCTDGARLSESLQILTVPVSRDNFTFPVSSQVLQLTAYDDNLLPLTGSLYEIVQNEAGLPVKIRTERRIGVLYAIKYFEVTKEERLVLMSSKYDLNGNKLHSTMFVVLIYNINSDLLNLE